MAIVKNFIEQLRISKVLMTFYYITNISDLQIFFNEIKVLLKPFEILHGNASFVSLFFLNERNITISLLQAHFKCTFQHYAKQNSNFINKPFLNYRSSNILFCFLSFLVNVYFNKALVKNFVKKLSSFNTNSKIHFKMQDITEYQDAKPCDTKMVAL